MRILVLVDHEAAVPVPSRRRRSISVSPDLMEAHIAEALQAAGYEVEVAPVLSPLQLDRRLRRSAPDLVYNLALHFDSNRREALRIAALLDILGIPYTGSGTQGILRACDKALSKHAVRMIGLRVPQFVSVPVGAPPPGAGISLPAIVKPRFEGGSDGITENSLVRTRAELVRRVAWIHRRYRQPAVCEEYIPGREITVGLLGNGHPMVLPVRERVFGRTEEGGPQFASHRVKRDANYCKKWNVEWKNAQLPPQVASHIQEASLAIYRELRLRDYARIDFRLMASGEPVFLEANHVPELCRTSQFFRMFAEAPALNYPSLIEYVAAVALRRHGRSTPRLRRIARVVEA